MKLEEYYNDSTSLYEDVEELVGIDKESRDQLNILVLNIVLKYITEYLEISERPIDLIKKRVHKIMYDRRGLNDINQLAQIAKWVWWWHDPIIDIMQWLPIGDDFWLDCLLDINQTSAIFKEIALEDKFESDNFQSLDLGSWTWILSLAAYIAWKRKWEAKWEILFVDQSKEAIDKSAKIFAPLSWNYNFNWLKGDIIDPKLYTQLELSELSFFISETISNTTPPFSIDIWDWELMYGSDLDEKIANFQKFVDPFPIVLSHFIKNYPELYTKIKARKIAMFPNFATKQYKPDVFRSTINLTTWTNNEGLQLHKIWEEFDVYEWLDVVQPRWEHKDEEKFEEFRQAFCL